MGSPLDWLFGNSGKDFHDANDAVKPGMQGTGYGVPVYGGTPDDLANAYNSTRGSYANIATRSQGMGERATAQGNQWGNDAANMGSQWTQAGQGMQDLAGQYRGQGNQYGVQADTSFGNQGADRAQTLGAIDRLQNFYQQGPGPSAAQAQLQQSQDANMSNAIALARSGRGAGANASSMRNALWQNAATQQQGGAQMANLRAQEAQGWRQNQLGAMGAEQSALGNLRSGDLGAYGQSVGAMGQANQTGLGYGQLGQGYGQLGLGYNQLGQGYRQGGMQNQLAYEGLGSNSQQFGDTLANRIMQGQLSADTSRYGADQGVSINNSNIEAAENKASAGLYSNLLGAGLMSSDIRAKKDIQPASAVPSLREVFGREDSGQPPTYGQDDIRDPWGADLRPAQAYSYEYKDPAAVGAAPGRHVGPMAQDLEKTPAGASAVVDTPRGKAVDTGRLSLVNSSAISETQRRQDEHEERLRKLEALLDNSYATQSADTGPRY